MNNAKVLLFHYEGIVGEKGVRIGEVFTFHAPDTCAVFRQPTFIVFGLILKRAKQAYTNSLMVCLVSLRLLFVLILVFGF